MATYIRIADNRELDNIPPEVLDELSIFGESELCRLKKIKNPRRRAESASGLFCLREALEYLNITKENKNFIIARDEDGRPSFADTDLPDFSIAHDGALSVAVLADGKTRVGVDIEKTEKEKGNISADSQKKLAERFFSAVEKERLREKAYQTDEFFRIWTEKEAYAKKCGKGLSKILAESEESENKNEKFLCFEITIEEERYILTLCAEDTECAWVSVPEGCYVNKLV